MPAQRKTNQSRRLTGAGLIAVTAATLLMMAWAIFPTAAEAIHVQPTFFTGNPDCGDLGDPDLTSLTKFEPVSSDTQAGVTITVDDALFDWTSQVGIDAVIVKGGNNSNVYFYDEETSDTDLHAPINPNNNKPFGLSHIEFCIDEDVTPDLGITKSASSTQVDEGDAFSYTIEVKNNGDGDATGVVVSDDLHDKFTAVSATFDGPGANDGPCTVAPVNQITCNIGTLGAGESATVTINATAPELSLTDCTRQYPNKATVDSDQTEPETSNEVTVTVTGTGCETPDLGITKSASSTQVDEGDAFSYTIEVKNNGDGDATGVVVSDDLHDKFTAVSATFDGPGANDGPCTVAPVNQITCNIGTLGAGESATVTINATAPELSLTDCTRQYPNKATVDSDQTEPETSNEVTVTVTGTGCETPDLGITKSASSTQVDEGDAFSYTIEVKNNGDGDATGVVVSDDLHDKFTAVSATFDGPGANDGPCTVAPVNQITCNIGTLGAGESATVTINATAPELSLTDCTRQYPNKATVDSDQTEPETSNEVTVTVTGTGCEPTTTTTTPGGGGGGTTTTPPPAPTTTTTTSQTVAPTTIHKSTTTTDEVLPTTVSPGGTAFTGVENVVPIGAVALMLMTSGSGLLWAGSRRKRDQNQDEE